MTVHASIRPTAVAGLFYPDEGSQLIEDVLSMIESAPAALPKKPKALIAPHAGYIYSGSTAAAAYARLAPWGDTIERVVLLGPSHRVPLRGLALPSCDAFATPLGWVPVDRAACAAIRPLRQVSLNDNAHAAEHSLEVHLPFLQAVLDHFSLVPLVVGESTAEEVAEVLDQLWGDEQTLIVVSTDLSHYLPYRTAQYIDQGTGNAILGFATDILTDQACGAHSLNGFLLAAARHGLDAELVKLCNSGDSAGDRERVVGYGAFAFYPQELLHA